MSLLIFARLGEGAGGYLSACLRRGRTGLVMAALRGKLSSRVSLSLYGSAYLQKRVSLGLHPVSLRKSKEMGWNRQQGGRDYYPIKRRTRNRERQGGLVIALSTCAPIRWEGVDGLSCDSTPFLWCLPKETVSSRQRKALFLPWRLHHSRERCCLGCLYSSSPDLGRGLVG